MQKVNQVPQGKDNQIVTVIRNKWLQSGIAGIPFMGGPIQSYLSNVVQEVDARRWNSYWESVEARLQQLDSDKIDIEYFSSEDFIQRLRRIHAEVTFGADDTKLVYLRDYFVACASMRKADVTWKDVVLTYLREMTGSHLIVLRVFHDRQFRLSYKDRFELPQRTSASPLTLNDINVSLEKSTQDSALVEIIVSDLSARGLVAPWVGEPQEPKGWSVSDTGLRLMRFLLDI